MKRRTPHIQGETVNERPCFLKNSIQAFYLEREKRNQNTKAESEASSKKDGLIIWSSKIVL